MTSKILKEDLALKPFKESTVHLLKSPDYKKKGLNLPNGNFKTRILNHERIICTDEAFYLIKTSNKQNNRFGSRGEPLFSTEKPLNDKKFFFIDFRRQG